MTFPCYPDYKDSGVEWLGDVPVGWGVSRVKFDSYVKARVGWHGLKSDEFTDEGPYLVTGSDFKNKTVDWSNCYHCTDERFEQDEFIQLKENDLLITKDGTIGKLILVENLPGKATLNSGIFVVRPLHGKYSTKFYFWLLQSSAFFDFVGINKTGSTIVHLYQETFENLPYALPPLVEQLQIARFLNHETARIDALIEEQQRLIELLKEKRQAVISHAVTKGLDPTVPIKDSGVEWLGEVPAHWTVTRLRRICIEINDINHVMPVAVETGVSFLSAKDLLDDGTLNFTEDVKMISESDFMALSKKICPRRGDIIYSRIGACLGKARLVETDERFLVSYSCCVVRVIEHIACPRFIQHLLDGEMILTEARLRTQGIGVPDLGLGEIGRFPIALPPVSEQKQIARYLDDQAGKFRALTAEAKRATNLLQEHRSALISAAVTGKIDVRGWQPPVSTQAPKFEVAEAV